MGSDDAEDKHDNDEGKVEKKKKKKEKKERGKPRSRSRSRGRSRARRTEAKAHTDNRRRSSVRRSASTVGSSGGKAVLKPARANPAEDTSGAASGSKSATAETGKDDGPAKAESPNPKLPMIRKSGPKMNGKNTQTLLLFERRSWRAACIPQGGLPTQQSSPTLRSTMKLSGSKLPRSTEATVARCVGDM